MLLNKKYILAIIFLCLFSIVNATTYYVSSSGNDASNGLTESTSWNSITKVNSVFSSFKPGDMVLFKRGDTFYGSLTVAVSGASGNPIIIGAYGTGNNPVLSGFTTLTGWTNYGGGIYSKAVSPASTPNMLLLDGVNTPLGRTPIGSTPASWPSNVPQGDTYTSGSMYDAALSGSPNMVGAEIVIRTEYWTVERRKVLTHSGGTVTYGNTSYTPKAGFGYFFQNHLNTLNAYGEWYYSGGTIYVYFGTENPTNHTVKLSTIDNIITNTKSYIKIDGLTLEGGNAYGVYLSGASYSIVKNCTVRYGGNHGIYGINSPYTTIEYNTVNDNNNFGIMLYHNWNNSCNNSTITHNTVSNIGMILGMGDPSSGFNENNGSYSGILAESNYSTISYNTIENIGYDGIVCGGQGLRVQYNYISKTNLNKADGGAIYSYRGTATDKLIDHNIIVNLPSLLYGLPTPLKDGANAIYLDGSSNFTITNNTIAFVGGKGIYVNSNHNNTVENNTFYECLHGIYVMSEPDRSGETNGQDGHAKNHVIRYNISIGNTISNDQEVLRLVTQNDESDLSQFGVINYNYYASPLRSDDYVCRWYKAWNWTPADTYVKNINIAEVRSLYHYDVNSTMYSTVIPDVKKIRFEYNTTAVNKIVALDAGYIDVKGTKYSGSITLLPFTSLVLMPDPNSTVPASSPLHVSSAIQNATPGILEMTYNLSLAAIVPSASAFTVNVNSVNRTVSSVSVSGTLVQLTLASPVIYGDIVTVGYTKPAANPLQAPAGGQAATISAQSVTNLTLSPSASASPLYVSSAIQNTNPGILDMTYNISLATLVPSASAFSVNVNSVKRTVSAVSVSGTHVLLTLASPVIYSDIVTVGYTKPAANQLQAPSGDQAATISAQSVTNLVSNPSVLGYINSAVGNSSPANLEINYNLTLANILPAASSFSVSVNSANRPVNSVSISGNSIILILATEVVYGDVITVAYNKPATNPVQSTTGLVGATMSAQSVTNKVEPVGLAYLSSAIENSTADILEINYNEPLDQTVPAVSAFEVIVNGVKREVTSISISGSTVILTLASPVIYGDVITLSYISPSSNQLKKATGEAAVSFSFPQPVTNNLAKIATKKAEISVYPNPASEYINISILETSLAPQTMRIFDLSGKLRMESKLNTGDNSKILINLKTGIYIVQVTSGSVITLAQKLIIL